MGSFIQRGWSEPKSRRDGLKVAKDD